MHWPYEKSAYQVASVDDLAVFYGVHSDGMSLRGQSFDLSSEELDQSLRVGGFRLVDVAATPEGQTPFIGDFVAPNGSRQLVGLDLTGVAVKGGRATQALSTGSVLSRAIGGALRGGFRRRGATEDGSPGVVPDALLREAGRSEMPTTADTPAGAGPRAVDVESALPTEFRRASENLDALSVASGVCPYLRKREAVPGAVVGAEPAGSESAAAREYRCAEAQGMLVMTVARLDRLCQGGEFTTCRHYRYNRRGELETAERRSASGD